MAHFAELDESCRVVAVVTVANDAITRDGVENEALGVSLLSSLRGHSRFMQTSRTGRIRKRYAAIGMTYDSARDAFIPPRPFPSWTLDEQTCDWMPPVPSPTDGLYMWDESSAKWVRVDELASSLQDAVSRP